MTKSANLRWEVLADDEAVSVRAVEIIGRTLGENPRALICLPTGETPTKTYARLGAVMAPDVFSLARWLQLDEWGGLKNDEPSTCFRYLMQHVVGPLRLRPEQLTRFHSSAEDPLKECARIAEFLDENGPIDLCLLGLGHNGHLGLIEPAPSLKPRVHVAALSPSTRQHSMLRGLDTQRLYGLTLGIGDLLRSRHLLLLVTGSQKRAALQQLRSSAVRTDFPASFLYLHDNVTILCDVAAWS